jgi:hypothetical protein
MNSPEKFPKNSLEKTQPTPSKNTSMELEMNSLGVFLGALR